MLIKRLKKRKDFLLLSSKGNKIVTKNFIFIYLYNKNNINFSLDAFVRIGFTASKKIGNAVERNRAKRRLKAVVKIIFQKDKIVTLSDIVLIARKKILNSDFSEIIEDLEHSTKKLFLEK